MNRDRQDSIDEAVSLVVEHLLFNCTGPQHHKAKQNKTLPLQKVWSVFKINETEHK